MEIKINENKRIGKVIYFTEGDVGEKEILIHVFHNVLNYRIVSYDKRSKDVITLQSDKDIYSTIYIAPSKHSSIKKIDEDIDYLDDIYKLLKEYGLNRDECAKYYLFDRDRKSNRPKHINKYLPILKNARDNGNEIDGLILLSYPSIESFVCLCFKDEKEFSCGYDIKDHIETKGLSIEDVDIERIKECTLFVINTINKITKQDFDINNLDDMSNLNKQVFDFEEETYIKNKTYVTLSLLVLSLIDLGIIEMY